MIILSGADLVLPDRLLGPGTLVIEADRITEVRPGTAAACPGADHVDLRGFYVVPGFIDVHVHGVDGADVLDGPRRDSGHRRAAAAFRRDSLLPDHDCLCARTASSGARGRRAARVWRRRNARRVSSRRPPREQLPQPRVSGRAAGRLPAPAARSRSAARPAAPRPTSAAPTSPPRSNERPRTSPS